MKMRTKAIPERAPALLLVAALLASCAGGGEIDITKPVTGEAATNAEKAYKKGLEEKKSHSYIEATRYLEWVKNNFPYSQYSALSELALADMAFERDDFGSAATAYADFVKSHPSHPKADYAAFRVGLSYYRDKPSDWFVLPPSSEKDQATIRSALDALQRFALKYPKSEYLPKARELIAELRERLAAHERYVANFYWKRKVWKGAAARLTGLADTYGDLEGGKVRSDALWRASDAYRRLGDVPHERLALNRLLQEAPDSEHRADAERRLGELPAEAPVPAASAPEVKGGEANKELEPRGGAPLTAPEPTVVPPRPSPVPETPQPAKPGGGSQSRPR